MLLTADQHRRLAEVYEEAAADQSHSFRRSSVPCREGGAVSMARARCRTEGEGSPPKLVSQF
jgi:hypothetical protein